MIHKLNTYFPSLGKLLKSVFFKYLQNIDLMNKNGRPYASPPPTVLRPQRPQTSKILGMNN